MSLYELAEEASIRFTLTTADMMAAVKSILAIIQPLDQAMTWDNAGLGRRNIQLRR
jgi:hypothetical protein